MLYLRIKKQCEAVNFKTMSSRELAEGELLTFKEYEKSKYDLKRSQYDIINISKHDTYISFGVRLERRRLNNEK